MKIGVLIKQVPARDSELSINADQSWIDEAGLEFESSEPDDYALEAGLQLKEAQGGEVVVGLRVVRKASRREILDSFSADLHTSSRVGDRTEQRSRYQAGVRRG